MGPFWETVRPCVDLVQNRVLALVGQDLYPSPMSSAGALDVAKEGVVGYDVLHHFGLFLQLGLGSFVGGTLLASCGRNTQGGVGDVGSSAA